jgi:hypothetical protein
MTLFPKGSLGLELVMRTKRKRKRKIENKRFTTTKEITSLKSYCGKEKEHNHKLRAQMTHRVQIA